MKTFFAFLAFLFTLTASAQVPPFVRNSFNTNDDATARNLVTLKQNGTATGLTNTGGLFVRAGANTFAAISSTGLVNGVEISVEAFGASRASANNQPAFQAAFNFALRANSLGTNFVIVIPPGTFNFTAPILLTNCMGIVVRGSGRNNTVLTANHAGPVIRTDGCWFSIFDGISFYGATTHAGGVFELDGNRAGDFVNFGVQGNTFRDCFFYGSGVVANGLSVCPLGGSAGQGSENLFLNCHFQSCTNAGYYQNGFNALNNTFIGGNVQACRSWGLYCTAGQINVYSMGFQNGGTAGQGSQTNYDIGFGDSAGEWCVIDGCRSESLRAVSGGSAPVIVRGWTCLVGPSTWAATTAYGVSNIIVPTVANGFAYRCTVAGTSGSSQPTWTSGSISDGTATWVAVSDYIFRSVAELSSSTVLFGRVQMRSDASPTIVQNNSFSHSGWLDTSSYSDHLTYTDGPILFGNKVNGTNDILSSYASPFLISIGQRPILWNYGRVGVLYPDVGFTRNDGVAGTDGAAGVQVTKNSVGLIGSLGRPFQPTGTGSNLDLVGGIGSNTLGGGGISFWTQPPGGTTALERVSIKTNGLVGIKTNAPGKDLDVAGVVGANNGTAAAVAFGNHTVNSGLYFPDDVTVGISAASVGRFSVDADGGHFLNYFGLLSSLAGNASNRMYIANASPPTIGFGTTASTPGGSIIASNGYFMGNVGIGGTNFSTNGFASFDTNAPITFATTGYTNRTGRIVQVSLLGTALTVTKFETNTTQLFSWGSVTGPVKEILKPNQYLTTSGTLTSNNVEPF